MGEKVRFTGRVKTVEGEPVGNAIVNVETSITEKMWTPLVTAQTDRDGAYTAGVAFHKPGKFFVRARFPGA